MFTVKKASDTVIFPSEELFETSEFLMVGGESPFSVTAAATNTLPSPSMLGFQLPIG